MAPPAVFAAGDIVRITGGINAGVYEVSSHPAGILTVRSTLLGLNAQVEDFSLDRWADIATDTGLTITKVNIGVLRFGTDGRLEQGSGQVTGITFTDLVTGPTTSVNNAIARFDGVTGDIIQDYSSNAPTISDTGALPLATGPLIFAIASAIQTTTGQLDITTASGFDTVINQTGGDNCTIRSTTGLALRIMKGAASVGRIIWLNTSAGERATIKSMSNEEFRIENLTNNQDILFHYYFAFLVHPFSFVPIRYALDAIRFPL